MPTAHIRHVDFGEGNYCQTETFIRSLLVAAQPDGVAPAPTDVPDATPTEPTTPETYLGCSTWTISTARSLPTP